MEIIGYGILLAIGFYIAPIVLMFLLSALSIIGVGICKLFGGCR
jgi:hypothetical protein